MSMARQSSSHDNTNMEMLVHRDMFVAMLRYARHRPAGQRHGAIELQYQLYVGIRLERETYCKA